MHERVVTTDNRDFRPAFVDVGLENFRAEVAPAIGFGISQNRDHSERIFNPHGFSIFWLRLVPELGVSPFTLDNTMVVIPRSDGVRISLHSDGEILIDLGA